jgi:isopentenyl phosphate kinase
LGRVDKFTILKLGGSLITNKEKALSPNMRNIKNVSREVSRALSDLSGRLFLVHGGGSFGHFYARKYGLSRKLGHTSSEGIARTTGAMIELHSILLRELLQVGVPCETILTSQMMNERDNISVNGMQYIDLIWQKGLVPISFGNVLLSSKGARIISGDVIALALTAAFGGNNARVVFAMDVDGIYRDSSMRGSVIEKLRAGERISGSEWKFDVTGGVGAKVKVGCHLAKLGAKVFFVNGSKPDRICRLLSGDDSVKATMIYPEKRAT